MGIIAEVEVESASFELGRVLAAPGRADITLEDIVPIGDEVVPLFWLDAIDRPEFVAAVESHEGVNELTVFEEANGQTLYALKWDATQDRLLGTINDLGGFVLRGTGEKTTWTLQIRFKDDDDLSEFTDHCETKGLRFTVKHLYYPTRPGASPWYGLTDAQHEAIELADDRGYYDIPRKTSTSALGEELGITDQAVTERLRRGIDTLIHNTLHAPNSR